MPREELRSLLELTPGQSGVLRRVGNKDPQVLRYLTRLDLTPGRTVRLVSLAPFNGPVTLEIVNADHLETKSSALQILGCDLAEQLYIARQPS